MRKREQHFAATSGNACRYTLTENRLVREIRMDIRAEWVGHASDSDIREFHNYMRRLASKRGKIKEFIAEDRDVIPDRAMGAIERFVESSDPLLPIKPV